MFVTTKRIGFLNNYEFWTKYRFAPDKIYKLTELRLCNQSDLDMAFRIILLLLIILLF